MLIKSDEPTFSHITETPRLGDLREELEACLTESSVFLDQYRHDFETRFCLWDAQSRDGRRWQQNHGTGSKVRPWDGASDVRPFTADDIIGEQVDVMLAAYSRATIQVTAIQSNQLDWSGKITILINWMLRNHMAGELGGELEKFAQWRQTYGLSLMGVWWQQEYRLSQVLITLAEMLEKAVALAEQGNPAPLQSLADPLQDERTIAEMIRRSPVLDRQGARRVLRQLREEGQAEVPRVTVQRNQPCWEALRPFLDVFFPTETSTLRAARWIQRRRLLTLPELETKVSTGQWSREWAIALYEHRGRSFSALNDYRTLNLRNTENALATSTGQRGPGSLGSDKYVEVWDAYYPGLDARTGVPVMMHTVWSPLVDEELYGRHEPFGYEHGEQPFIAGVREHVESALADSRSVPEIAATFQGTIKTQRDARNDVAQMTTVPPLLVPMWRAGAEVKLGPAAQIPEKTSGELKWMQPPPQTANGDKAEASAAVAIARYFGLMHGEVDPRRTQLSQERLVGKFLGEVGQIVKMTLQLCQQFMSDTEAERVVGKLRIPFHLTREEIQGQFSLLVNFDAQNLNPELVKQKLEGFQKFVLAFDTEGVVNRSKLAELGARMLDPFWADEIVGDPAAAAQSEAEDELKNLAGIAIGVEPPMRPEGQNYQLRLATLIKGVEDNPWLKQRLGAQPDSQAMLAARVQHLQTMAEQYGINKQIGRTGAEPGLQKLREKGEAQPPALMEGAQG